MTPLVSPKHETVLIDEASVQSSKASSSIGQSQPHLGSLIPVDPSSTSKNTDLKLDSDEGRFPSRGGVDLQSLQEVDDVVEERIVRHGEGQREEVRPPNQEIGQVIRSGFTTPVSSESLEMLEVDLRALPEILALTPDVFKAARTSDDPFVTLNLPNGPSVDVYGFERETVDGATFDENVEACRADLLHVLDRSDFNGGERTPVVLSFPVEVKNKDGAIIKREDHSVVLRRETGGRIAILDPNKKAFHEGLKKYLLAINVAESDIVSYELGYGVQSKDHKKIFDAAFEAAKAKSKKDNVDVEFHSPFVRHGSPVESRNCFSVAISIARSITGYPGDGIPESMRKDVEESLKLPKSGALKKIIKDSLELEKFVNENKARDMDRRLIAATTSFSR